MSPAQPFDLVRDALRAVEVHGTRALGLQPAAAPGGRVALDVAVLDGDLHHLREQRERHVDAARLQAMCHTALMPFLSEVRRSNSCALVADFLLCRALIGA